MFITIYYNSLAIFYNFILNIILFADIFIPYYFQNLIFIYHNKTIDCINNSLFVNTSKKIYNKYNIDFISIILKINKFIDDNNNDNNNDNDNDNCNINDLITNILNDSDTSNIINYETIKYTISDFLNNKNIKLTINDILNDSNNINYVADFLNNSNNINYVANFLNDSNIKNFINNNDININNSNIINANDIDFSFNNITTQINNFFKDDINIKDNNININFVNITNKITKLFVSDNDEQLLIEFENNNKDDISINSDDLIEFESI